MMEAIWDDLAHDSEILSSPAWHAQALNEAEQLHTEQQVDFVSWDVAKKMMRGNQERDLLRNLLVQGAQSAPTGLADEAYFASLRSRINSVAAR
jgi:hypothetical protein